ncbi:hypothetical protein R9X47_21725 [Wukongibacter baidiensis]|uniref:hypothetical protein n=1 Tax=Wukongibacter baidiensis TaxID=1723361 RepID=UPI003D7F2746
MYFCVKCKQTYEESEMAMYKPSLKKGFCSSCDDMTSIDGIKLQVENKLMTRKEANLAIKTLSK